MAKTGPHSFTDATGVEWHIEGYSRVCGAAYVDCRSTDGKALTVRPVAYLGPAGLTIPDDAPPPKKPATPAEKKKGEESYAAMPVKDIVPEAEQTAPPAKPKRTRKPKAAPAALDLDALAARPPEGQVIPLPEQTLAQVIPIRPVEAITEEQVEASRDLVGEVNAQMAVTYAEQALAPAEQLRMAIIEGGDGDTPPPRRACGHKFFIRTCAECAKDRARARVVNKHSSGWDIDIARPGPWGNPYSHEPDSTAQHIVGSREEAIDLYRQWMRQRVRAGEPGLVQALASLHGLRLGCTCAPLPCHGDVLVDAAEWAASITHFEA